MNIQLASTMRFGDLAGLRDFFFIHRLVHLQIDAAITQAGGGSLPNATLDSEAALAGWGHVMTTGQAANDELRAFTDWLQLHANLHDAEYQALKFGNAPELSEFDATSPEQFYSWMQAHASVHDLLGQAVGVN